MRRRMVKREKADAISSANTSSAKSSAAALRKTNLLGGGSAKRVLDIAELCEQVLTYLPLRNLLKARKVCRSFRDSIDSSPKLQHALFFKKAMPATDQPVWVVEKDQSLVIGEEALARIEEAEQTGTSLSKLQVFGINPLLFRTPPAVLLRNHVMQSRSHCKNHEGSRVMFGSSFIAFRGTCFEQYEGIHSLDEIAICRGMLLGHPPVTKIMMEFSGLCVHHKSALNGEPLQGPDSNGTADSVIVENEDGVTFGEIVDVMKGKVNYQVSCRALVFLDGYAAAYEEMIKARDGVLTNEESEHEGYNFRYKHQ